MKDGIWPFEFTSPDVCHQCGEKSYKLMDEYGHVVDNPIYTAYRIICSNCGAEWYIRWNGFDIDEVNTLVATKEERNQLEKDIISFSLSNIRDLNEVDGL